MPRRINPKCLACAQLEANDAIALHGPEGDNCWDSSRCPRRRSHYRNRRENNAKRRAQWQTQQTMASASHGLVRHEPGSDASISLSLGDNNVPEVIVIKPDLEPVAYLYLYRETRKDAPLHALAISVWEGKEKLIEIAPIHCSGLRNRQIQSYLQKSLNYLQARYGIKKFEPEIRLEPVECPIQPCPLKIRLEDQL